MSRPLRIECEGALYHVTSRGYRRGAIVEDDMDRAAWVDVLAGTCGRFGWRLHDWCLMDNHYHLLLQTPQPNLSDGMHQLNGVWSQQFNRRHGRVGQVFQGRFKAIMVERDSYLLELARCVVLNPVRARTVPQAQDHAWSSYRATLGLAPRPAARAAAERIAVHCETQAFASGHYRQCELAKFFWFERGHGKPLGAAADSDRTSDGGRPPLYKGCGKSAGIKVGRSYFFHPYRSEQNMKQNSLVHDVRQDSGSSRFSKAALKRHMAVGAMLWGAASFSQAAGWSAELTVTSVFTEASTDLIVVYTSGGGVYATGCAANSWIFPASTTARASRGYATLLAAVATGKKIKFWFSDTCSTWGFHEGTSVMLVN